MGHLESTINIHIISYIYINIHVYICIHDFVLGEFSDVHLVFPKFIPLKTKIESIYGILT